MVGGMRAFVTTWTVAFGLYLLLAAGSGGVLGVWSWGEIAWGAGIAAAVAVLAGRWFRREAGGRVLNPLRGLRMAGYACGRFFVELAKANVDVAWRVLTGRIRPGVVKVRTGMKNRSGHVMLANSITLTPGTLTVEEDEEAGALWVHMLQVPDGWEERDEVKAEELFGTDCPGAIRRITE